MRAPNPAESLSPPIPSPDITQQVIAPNTIDEAHSPGRRRAVGVASAMLVTTALAGLAPSPGVSGQDAETRANHGTANSYTANDMRPVGYASANNVYSGRVTIPASRSARTSKTLQQPSLVENDGVLIAKAMGVSPAQVAEGKKTEVTIAGIEIDLADYTKPTRVAESWVTSKDCAWNFAYQDILVAGEKAKLSPEQIKKAADDPENVQRVMRGYFQDNPSLREAPHFLNTGVGYVAKHARAEADELVGSMRQQAKQPAKPKTDPDTKAQAQPDYKPKHAAPETKQAPSTWERVKQIAVPAAKLGGLATGVVLLVGGAFLGYGRLRRRRQERYEAASATKPTSGNHHLPDPDGPGTPPPPEDFGDLREITENDAKQGYDPVDPPSGAHAAIGDGLGRSPYAPPAEARSETPSTVNNRARFSYGGPVEPSTRRARHLRSVPITPNYPLASEVSERREFPELQPVGVAEVSPEVRLVDAPTDPTNGRILHFNRSRELEGRGWVDPLTGKRRNEYAGVHRRAYVSDIVDDYTDATRRVAAAV